METTMKGKVKEGKRQCREKKKTMKEKGNIM